MSSRLIPAALLVACSAPFALAGAPSGADGFGVKSDDWPWWRGPNRDGIAAPDQDPPVKFGETENVIWKVPVPGRGHGSATVFGNRVYLTAADEKAKTQSVLCFDRATGAKVWETTVHSGGLNTKGNKKASAASGSVACDGNRLYITFVNPDAVTATALELDGKIAWQTKITDYVEHQGYGSSPALYGPLVIVSADNKGGGRIAGLNRTDGKFAWKHDRPKTPNYASPAILPIAGKDRLFFTGCDLVTCLDPLSGEKIWEIPGSTTECVTTTVTDGSRIFTSGGYPKNHVAAIRADGKPEVVWQNTTRIYVPSMLVFEGHLYGVTDGGVATCWKSDTGALVWQGRLGGTFSASPVLAGKRIWAVNEAGEFFVFKADPAGFEQIAKCKLGDEVYATPTICGGRIYQRVAHVGAGGRREMLYCLGTK